MTAVLLKQDGGALLKQDGGNILLQQQPVAQAVTRVDAVDIDGNLVGIVGFYRRLTWTYELGQDGAGTIEIDALDDSLRSTLRAANMLRVYVDGTVRAGVVLRDERMDNAGEQPTLTLSGPGPKGLLTEAAVYPTGGLTALTDGVTTRRLDWTEPAMDATRMGGTITDQGGIDTPVTSKWDPAEFDDMSPRWIWVDESGTSVSPGDVYLRKDFTTTSTQTVALQASVDNEADIFVDGIELLSIGGESRWLETLEEVFVLPAGDHTLAIRAYNDGGPAGVVASIMGVNSDGTANPDDSIVFTETTGWFGVAYPTRTPGMLAGEIITLLIDEAQARGAIQSVSVDLTDTEQSPIGSGVSWTTEYALTVQVGASVSKAFDQLAELGPDIWVTGDPMVQAVTRKGSDKSATVHLRAGRDVESVSHTATRTDGNLVLTQTQDGAWSEHAHSSTGDASIGRREYAKRAGSATDDTSVTDLVNATFESHALRIVESEIRFLGSAELVVHQDFELGDDVSIPAFDTYGTEMSARVLSISGEVSADNPVVTWSAETQETQ